jgi:peptide/nickel transport system substrate-binding protein
MSILEEATISTVMPAMGVFNNLVVFDQHVPQNIIKSIVPDLAESWSWDTAKTALTFKLRHGVKWHDGQPFTAADVKCTWDLLQGRATEKFRLNPRKSWYRNLDEVTVSASQKARVRLSFERGHDDQTDKDRSHQTARPCMTRSNSPAAATR